MELKATDATRRAPGLRHDNPYQAELDAAHAAVAGADVDLAFHHLERAHILGQRHTRRHVQAHWRMLRLAASTGAWREVVGQATRIVAAAVFSRIWVPVGNTGRAHVSAMKPMRIPDDLRSVLESGTPGKAHRGAGGKQWR